MSWIKKPTEPGWYWQYIGGRYRVLELREDRGRSGLIYDGDSVDPVVVSTQSAVYWKKLDADLKKPDPPTQN